MNRRMPRTFAVLVAVLAPAMGCLRIPPAMTLAASVPPPAAGSASVVLVRPSQACDSGDYAVVVDERGRFVGNVGPGTRLAVEVSPGSQIFYAWNHIQWVRRSNPIWPTGAARLNLTKGQTRYLLLDGCTGTTTLLNVVAQGDALWGDLQDGLRSTKPIVADRAAGQALLEQRPAELRRRLEVARRQLVELDTARERDAVRAGLAAEAPR